MSLERSFAAGGGGLTLRSVTKSFGALKAVDHVTLDIRPGEHLTLLGPSGSGKTTTLRIIAGFIPPDVGTVLVDGRDITGTPPHRRDIGMVFQNYALFPHMTAAQNIAFPLKVRAFQRNEIGRRVEEALALVRLEGLGGRSPRQLSGGQQQRVALARALVFKPRVLLMDEPLGALDKKLREAMQLEITRIGREVGVTVVYVTHDQEEALVMSDRIAVYHQGRTEQVGTGEELYQRPVSLFVATFIGESTVFRGLLKVEPEGPVVVGERWRMPVTLEACKRVGLASGRRAAVVVRPEWLRIQAAGDSPIGRKGAAVEGLLIEDIYLGALRKYVVDLGNGHKAIVRVQVGTEAPGLSPGRPVSLSWDVERSVVVADDESVALEPEEDRAEEAERGPMVGIDAGRSPSSAEKASR
jgi:putative spermidine/putrescine transport system ATP-binding protein